MSALLLIWIDADDSAPLLMQRVEDGIASTLEPLEAWGEASHPEFVIAFAPVSAVRLVEAELPDLPQLQKDAVAREQLSGEIAAAAHVVCGSSGRKASQSLVAWVDPARLGAWQSRIRAVGLEVNAIVPAALLISPDDVPCRALLCGEEIWGLADGVIPADLGFKDEAPKRALNPLSLVQGAVRLAEDPRLNLLTGPFAPRRSTALSAQKGRIAALVAAVALVTALIPAAQAWRTNLDAARLDETTRTTAAARVPQAANPVLALDEAVSARQGGGAGFQGTLQAVSSAVQAIPGAELSSLSFSQDGWMSLTVRAASTVELSQLAAKLKSGGFQVVQGSVSTEQGRQSGQMRVRG